MEGIWGRQVIVSAPEVLLLAIASSVSFLSNHDRNANVLRMEMRFPLPSGFLSMDSTSSLCIRPTSVSSSHSLNLTCLLDSLPLVLLWQSSLCGPKWSPFWRLRPRLFGFSHCSSTQIQPMGVGSGFPSEVMQQGNMGDLTPHGVNSDLWEMGD